MGNIKRLTDEDIIMALIEHGSARKAAASLGYSHRTLYERMKEPAFKELYAQTKTEMLKAATVKLQGQLCSAIETLVEIMTDEETASQTRVNSAVAILQYASRFTETTDILERLEAIEEAQALSNNL